MPENKSLILLESLKKEFSELTLSEFAYLKFRDLEAELDALYVALYYQCDGYDGTPFEQIKPDIERNINEVKGKMTDFQQVLHVLLEEEKKEVTVIDSIEPFILHETSTTVGIPFTSGLIALSNYYQNKEYSND